MDGAEAIYQEGTNLVFVLLIGAIVYHPSSLYLILIFAFSGN